MHGGRGCGGGGGGGGQLTLIGGRGGGGKGLDCLSDVSLFNKIRRGSSLALDMVFYPIPILDSRALLRRPYLNCTSAAAAAAAARIERQKGVPQSKSRRNMRLDVRRCQTAGRRLLHRDAASIVTFFFFFFLIRIAALLIRIVRYLNIKQQLQLQNCI